MESHANSKLESELENSGKVGEEDQVQSRGLDHLWFCGDRVGSTKDTRGARASKQGKLGTAQHCHAGFCAAGKAADRQAGSYSYSWDSAQAHSHPRHPRGGCTKGEALAA